MFHCIYLLFDFGKGAAAKQVMLLVCFRYMTAERVPVETQRGRSRIEASSCDSLCRSATEKCRNFCLQIGVELTVQHFEGECVLENLTQSTDRIFGSNLIISDAIGKLTQQVQVDGGMNVGQCSSFLCNLTKNVVSIEFRGWWLVEF
jgi:hypothetical protein